MIKCLFFIFICLTWIQADELSLKKLKEIEILNGIELIKVENNFLLIENLGDKVGFSFYKIPTGELVYKTNFFTGDGPGDININGPIDVQFNNNHIYILDASSTLNIFSLSLLDNKINFLNKIPLPINAWQFFLDKDENLYFRNIFSEYLLSKYKLISDTLKQSGNIINISNKKYLLNIIRNPLVNQGPATYSKEFNTIFIGFDYSTLILAINPDNNQIYKLSTPLSIPLPKGVIRGSHIEAPDAFNNTTTVIDFNCYENKLFVLYSGIKYRFWNFFKLKDTIEHGDILWIYDIRQNKFLKELKLPEYAKKIIIIDNYLILMSNIPKPHISIYSKIFANNLN